MKNVSISCFKNMGDLLQLLVAMGKVKGKQHDMSPKKIMGLEDPSN